MRLLKVEKLQLNIKEKYNLTEKSGGIFMEPFKLRASASGQLLSNPRNKSDLISAGAKTYVQTWLKEQIYGVKKKLTVNT